MFEGGFRGGFAVLLLRILAVVLSLVTIPSTAEASAGKKIHSSSTPHVSLYSAIFHPSIHAYMQSPITMNASAVIHVSQTLSSSQEPRRFMLGLLVDAAHWSILRFPIASLPSENGPLMIVDCYRQ